MSREILNYAREVLEAEGASQIESQPTNNGHYRLMWNIGNARASYVIGMRQASRRTYDNIRAQLRRKNREARERMGR